LGLLKQSQTSGKVVRKKEEDIKNAKNVRVAKTTEEIRTKMHAYVDELLTRTLPTDDGKIEQPSLSLKET
jgi:histidinol phosphatase-like enzyme